ncbi:MAG: hypothetical protein AAF433_08620 [Bacteroidota bacterium]
MKLLLLPIYCLWSLLLAAQWTPGDHYREYVWTTPASGEDFLRVGGRYGYASNPNALPDSLQRGDQLLLPYDLDLAGASRAEVVIERVQSHEDSRNLRISINGHASIRIPEPASIPAPATEYMFHANLTVPIPLEQLQVGSDNYFQLTLDSTQRWNWPQNIIYGLTFRIYYDAAEKDFLLPPSTGPYGQVSIASPKPETSTANATERSSWGQLYYPHREVPPQSYLQVDIPAGMDLDLMLAAFDLDFNGRGDYHHHWQTYRGEPHHQLGSISLEEPLAYSDTTTWVTHYLPWSTAWLPDQTEPMQIHARVKDHEGIYHALPPLKGLELAARPFRVELILPQEQPANWVTRSGEFSQQLEIEDLSGLLDYQLSWTSWSPCYANGLYLNEHLIWIREGDCYVYATHQLEFSGADLDYLQTGTNLLKTGKTPLFDGQMVHGMEVQWPGIQFKARFDNQ